MINKNKIDSKIIPSTQFSTDANDQFYYFDQLPKPLRAYLNDCIINACSIKVYTQVLENYNKFKAQGFSDQVIMDAIISGFGRAFESADVIAKKEHYEMLEELTS